MGAIISRPLNGCVPESPVYELPLGKRQQRWGGGGGGTARGASLPPHLPTKCLALPGSTVLSREVDTG